MNSQKREGFFAFIEDAQENRDLGEKFNEIKTLVKFKEFFLKDNPFYGLSEEELERIYYYRNKWCNEKTMEEMHEIICEGRGY